MDPTLVKAGLRPPPPAAAALTRVGSIDSSRRQDFDGQERASRGPPTHSKKREPRTFPLDKKVPIQGHGKPSQRMDMAGGLTLEQLIMASVAKRGDE